MQIDKIIAATEIISAYGVNIDGIRRTAAFGGNWSVVRDSEAAFASASAEVLVPFLLSAGRHTIEIYAGWQRDASEPVFVGEITNTGATYYPKRSSLTAGGYLRRTEVGLNVAKAFCNNLMAPEDLELVGAGYQVVMIDTDADIIIHILESYNITPATTGHSIVASDWVPAVLEPIVWEYGAAGWNIIQEIDRITDYRTADGRLGEVRRRRLYGQVPNGAVHTFHQGIDILDIAVATEIQVYNQVKVTGAAVPSDPEDPEIDDEGVVFAISPIGAVEVSPYVPDPPGVRTDNALSSSYIETFPDAQVIADRRLRRLREPLQNVTLTTFGCPEVDIGDGIGIVASAAGLNAIGFVVAHSMSGSPLRSTLTMRMSIISAGTGTLPSQPPIGQMLVSVTLEHVIIDSTVQPLAMITVDATASKDLDGTIVAYEIVLDGTTYTVPSFTHATLAPSPVTVTLTVTDDTGLTSEPLVRSVSWSPATTLVERLTAAEATQAEATVDGDVTWQSFVADVISVAPIALGGTILCGCEGGEIYRSTDMLLTAPTLVTTLPAAVNRLWNNEQMTDRWLAGLDNGDVWLSVDDGVTFTKQATLVGPVNDLSESPYQANQATAAVGNGIYTTWDLQTWPLLYDSVSEALRFAAGLYDSVSTIYSSHANGQIVRYRDEPASIEVVGTVPDGVARGLTLAVSEELLYCLTDTAEGKTYVMTPDGAFTPGPDLGTACNSAMRSGSGDWVYAACDGAIKKVLFGTQNTAYDIRVMTSPQRALIVGYGSVGVPVAPPPPPVNLKVAVATYHTSGGTEGGVWVYTPGEGETPGAWVLHAVGSTVRWRWTELIVSPHDASHWYIVGSPDAAPRFLQSVPDNKIIASESTSLSPMWESVDSGLTWTEVIIPLLEPDIVTGGGDYEPPANQSELEYFQSMLPIPLANGNLAILAVFRGVEIGAGDVPFPGLVAYRKKGGTDWWSQEVARRMYQTPLFWGVLGNEDDAAFVSLLMFNSGSSGPVSLQLPVFYDWENAGASVPTKQLRSLVDYGLTPFPITTFEAALRKNTSKLILAGHNGHIWHFVDWKQASEWPKAQGLDLGAGREYHIAYLTDGTVWIGARNWPNFFTYTPGSDTAGETIPSAELDAMINAGITMMRQDRQTGTGIVCIQYSNVHQHGAFPVFDGENWALLEAPNDTDAWIVAEAIGIPE